MAGKIVLQEHWGVAMPTAAGSIQTLYIYIDIWWRVVRAFKP